MAFWSFHGGAAMTSAIDTILEKEHFELDELLADDELLQECKALNGRLITYLSTLDVISQLFTYITVEPPPDASSERCFTFPFTASEVLSCDVPQIQETIIADECRPHLRRLLRFVDQPPDLNPVLCGYYAKVVMAIFRRSPERFLEILDEEGVYGGRLAYVRALLRHLHMQSIVELLTALSLPLEQLTAPPPPPPMLMAGGLRDAGPGDRGGSDKGIVDPWLDPADFTVMLADTAAASAGGEAHAALPALVAHLANSYGWASMAGEAPCRERLVNLALDAPSQSLRTAALAALCELLQGHASERDTALARAASASDGAGIGATDDGGAAARADAAEADLRVRPLADLIGSRIEGFVAMLNLEQEVPDYLEPFLRDGGYADCLLVMPVGTARLQLYEFVARSLPLLGAEAHEALAQCRFFEVVLDAVERYPRCTLLHAHVARMVAFALAEEGPLVLSRALVGPGALGHRLAAAAAPRSASPPSKAILGHALEMANKLAEWEQRNEGEAVALGLAADADWRGFVDGELAESNTNARKVLGGQPPTRGSELDSDEEELFASKELDLDSMAAALAKHQANRQAQAAGGDGGGHGDEDEDDEDRDVGAEIERRFGQYMTQQTFLNELDGGLSAISREQDEEAERTGGLGDDDDDFGTTKRDFFSGDDNGAGDDGFASLRSDDEFGDAGAGAGAFEADFGAFEAPAPQNEASSGFDADFGGTGGSGAGDELSFTAFGDEEGGGAAAVMAEGAPAGDAGGDQEESAPEPFDAFAGPVEGGAASEGAGGFDAFAGAPESEPAGVLAGEPEGAVPEAASESAPFDAFESAQAAGGESGEALAKDDAFDPFTSAEPAASAPAAEADFDAFAGAAAEVDNPFAAADEVAPTPMALSEAEDLLAGDFAAPDGGGGVAAAGELDSAFGHFGAFAEGGTAAGTDAAADEPADGAPAALSGEADDGEPSLA